MALNASVEAARAGDHGKGFAVVAEEVRSLAQRCAAAAKEIQDLINESNKHVVQGVELTKKTGDSFKEIVDSTKNLARLVAEIAQASGEQAAGVNQINMAISKMDEVTQQNAGLVQEELRVIEQLKTEAQKMAKVVGMFH
ncbi:MAG TPA: methyl-accepting chemotaxis protein [Alphaproteobacteria bacterium]|nr:methyl-accepting chemotaxis protein [Alphaproteobacteria bacterium]